MANFDLFINRLLRLEGGYVNNPYDRGGCTCKGITLPVFRGVYGAGLDCDDLKAITDDDAGKIYKSQYWNPCNADKIKSQRIANLLVDWAVNSGVRTACKGLQRILGVKVDGIIGEQTLNAINCFEDDGFIYDALMDERKEFYHRIVARDESQECFLKGWLNRLKEWERE